MVVPEMERRKGNESQSRPASRPYPSFSKPHSREAVNGVQESTRSKPEPITPEGTDLDPVQPPKSAPPRTSRYASTAAQAPPSPPLSDERREVRPVKGGASLRQAAGDTRKPYARRKSADHEEIYGKSGFSASRTSLRQAEEGMSVPKPTSAKPAPISKASFLGFFKDKGEKGGLASGKKSPLHASAGKPHGRKASDRGLPVSATEPRTSLSDAKSGRRPPTLLSNYGSSHSDDDLPRTPRGNEVPPRAPSDRKATPILEVFTCHGSDSDFDVNAGPSHSTTASPPPPPPPPAVAPQDIPRVDFLLQNGGLSNAVPRSFASASSPDTPAAYQQYLSPQPGAAQQNHIRSTFDPYHNLLEDFTDVISKNGSIAVATGYRSVAKGLLDRLESVFSRNLSSERCQCALCGSQDERQEPEEANRVTWGEVLELVSGRRQLPPWPPFILATSSTGLGISAVENQTPMQKLDMDVPEEYREHYIRQSKKTKQAVDTWLASQPEEHQSPPQEVDDETLTFAMLTNLEPSQRRAFTALLRELSTVPNSRSSTPMQADSNKPKFLSKTGVALQRFYRLPRAPRDPECSMYLLKNQTLHGALATLAAISNEEWETLISGRFDEFLRTGDTSGSSSASPVRRNQTPLTANGAPPSRTPTPGGAPSAQADEDTEIAVLAEVEREIYLGMESLEDAFESLHAKAEGVRRALRERSAGLALQAQARRGDADGGRPEARLGTPAVGGAPVVADQATLLHGHGQPVYKSGPGLDDDDGGLFDERSELAPDDSASNIGWKERERKRNKKRRAGASRRTERRTPAPVEEEDEG